MMKHILRKAVFCVLPILALLFAQVSSAQSVLRVDAGQTHVLPDTQNVLQLDVLELADGAVLKIPSRLNSLSIEAQKVIIGENVKILAHGEDASSLQPLSVNHPTEASNCQKPIDGLSGDEGAPGDSGVDLRLRLGLQSFGSLLVDTSGGRGADGQNGTNGQDAEQEESCNLMTGGNAGAGGNAGRGGDAGDIAITYIHTKDDTLLKSAKNKTRFIQLPGKPGSPGKAAVSGLGSLGRYINKKTLTGSKKWQSGGGKGAAASDGVTSRSGATAKQNVSISVVPAPIQATKRTYSQETHEPESLKKELMALKKAHSALLKRVEALEKK